MKKYNYYFSYFGYIGMDELPVGMNELPVNYWYGWIIGDGNCVIIGIPKKYNFFCFLENGENGKTIRGRCSQSLVSPNMIKHPSPLKVHLNKIFGQSSKD